MFHLRDVTEVTCTNSNPRPEMHGQEHVQAIDLTFQLTKPNDFLNEIEPGLRDFHYYNEAAERSGQTAALAAELMPAPDLRFPKLNREHTYGVNGERWRGYTFILDYGLGDERSNIMLQDVVLMPIGYTTHPDGIVDFRKITIQYNGNQLDDPLVFARLSGLATKGLCHIQLLAPESMQIVKGKGWRSGKPDTPPASDGGAPLLDAADTKQDDHVGDHGAFRAGDDDDVVHPAGSPEAALVASAEKSGGRRRRGDSV